jgi:hypothetical protein
MKVAFLSPAYPAEQKQFTRGLARVGATVIGVGDQPASALPGEVKEALAAYLQVPSLFDEQAAADHLVPLLAQAGVDRVECLWEPLVLLAATLRDRLGIGGMSRDTVVGFRDKQVMKDRLAAAGVRVPRSQRAQTAVKVREAAAVIGYPLIVKPIAGAGSANTYRCNNAAELEAALQGSNAVAEVSVEEFVDGEEFTYDAVYVRGMPKFESVSQYWPRPLVARSEQWISPSQITYADPYVPKLMPGIEMGRQVCRGLSMGTGFVHMEWYLTARGEVVFGEIGCRNGGGHFVDMMNWANDFDVFTEWARSVCWESFEGEPTRRYHVGMAFKRAQGEGRISAIHGMDRVREVCGQWLIADELLPVGSPRRNWKQTLVSDGFLAIKHPDLAKVHEMLELLISGVLLTAR